MSASGLTPAVVLALKTAKQRCPLALALSPSPSPAGSWRRGRTPVSMVAAMVLISLEGCPVGSPSRRAVSVVEGVLYRANGTPHCE